MTESIVCVDCKGSFTEEAWVEHDSSVDCVKPQMSLRTLFILVSLSALMWGLIGGGLTALVAQQPEEGLFFNCYISGNGECGPDAPWHGFVNLF